MNKIKIILLSFLGFIIVVFLLVFIFHKLQQRPDYFKIINKDPFHEHIIEHNDVYDIVFTEITSSYFDIYCVTRQKDWSYYGLSMFANKIADKYKDSVVDYHSGIHGRPFSIRIYLYANKYSIPESKDERLKTSSEIIKNSDYKYYIEITPYLKITDKKRIQVKFINH